MTKAPLNQSWLGGVFASMVLFFDIDCKPGFEFHSEVVGKDGDLLDELFYQSFVELCDVCFLLGDKVLQFLDPVHGFFPVVAVDLGLFLLFPESEDFVSDGIVMVSASGSSSRRRAKSCSNNMRSEMSSSIGVLLFGR